MVESTLLQAVIAAPDNDAPRLAYADALQRQGNIERAAFIRLQCTLAKMPIDDPRRPDLQQRESALLNDFGWEWARPLGRVVKEWKYQRGFIEAIELGLHFDGEKLADILTMIPLRRLRDPYPLAKLETLVAALPQLRQLQGIELWQLYVYDDDLLAQVMQSEHLANLSTLILRHESNGNLPREEDIIAALHAPWRSHLEELSVSCDGAWRGPSNAILEGIASSPYLRNLRYLDLEYAGDSGHCPKLGASAMRAFVATENTKSLEVLNLQSTGTISEAWNLLLNSPWLRQLSKLYMGGTKEIDEDGERICSLGDEPSWVEAFKNRTNVVEWEETYGLQPAGTSIGWRGQNWQDLDYRALLHMDSYLRRHDYAGLEHDYYEFCRRASPGLAREIAAINLAGYGSRLLQAIGQAFQVAKEMNAACVFIRLHSSMRSESSSLTTSPFTACVLVHQEYDPQIRTPRFGHAGLSTSEDIELQLGTLDDGDYLYFRAEQAGDSKINPATHYLNARVLAIVARIVDEYKFAIPAYFGFDAQFRVN